MEVITIIGWYGTETIGDRGILAGLLRVFSEKYTSFSIRLGSLFPFFSERCLIEDISFYNRISQNKLGVIQVFDINDICTLKKNINDSSIVCFGGGPLMDIPYTFIMEYAMDYAHRKGIATMILGCGVGPLSKKDIIKSVLRIIDQTDVCLFRDEKSVETYHILGGTKQIKSIIDPASFCASYFFTNTAQKEQHIENSIVMNFRDVHKDQYSTTNVSLYDDYFISLIRRELQTNPDMLVQLVPMHTFKHGGDDRYYLNYLRSLLSAEEQSKVFVHNNPLSLEDTMKIYFQAHHCYGMRFHAVLLQTLLNGRNIILDYTNPTKCKISGLSQQLSAISIYKHAYQSLSQPPYSTVLETPNHNPNKFHELIKYYFETFLESL